MITGKSLMKEVNECMPKKNGELMNAVSDGVYFCIIMLWLWTFPSTIFIGMLFNIPLFVIISIIEFIGGLCLLLYLNRDVPGNIP